MNKSLIIYENMSILEAMRVLGKTARKILFLCDGLKLLASLTDGDIRRFILKGGGINETVSKAANYNPKYLHRNDSQQAKQILLLEKINCIPVVDENMNIISIIFSDETLQPGSNIRFNIPVVIMAGGQGKRLHPYTKILPKPLIPVGEFPIVEHIINRFLCFGCNDFYLIVNHKKNMIKSYFSEINQTYKLNFIEEEKPLGTGGGISLLKGKIKSTFFLSNCDVLIDADYESIYEKHKSQNNIITMVCAYKNLAIPYGIVDIDDNARIRSMSEKPRYTFLTNTGIYLVEPRVIDELEGELEIGFPDIIEKYRRKGENVGVFAIDENSWLDMGQIEELETMRKKLEM